MSNDQVTGCPEDTAPILLNEKATQNGDMDSRVTLSDFGRYFIPLFSAAEGYFLYGLLMNDYAGLPFHRTLVSLVAPLSAVIVFYLEERVHPIAACVVGVVILPGVGGLCLSLATKAVYVALLLGLIAALCVAIRRTAWLTTVCAAAFVALFTLALIPSFGARFVTSCPQLFSADYAPVEETDKGSFAGELVSLVKDSDMANACEGVVITPFVTAESGSALMAWRLNPGSGRYMLEINSIFAELYTSDELIKIANYLVEVSVDANTSMLNTRWE